MISKKENEALTGVDPGTPGGAMLRRYWWPVGISADLKDRPTLVRVLGEDLALFRDGSGRVGLLAAQCSHRRANLCLGDAEADGLRCRYHGWKYSADGSVLDMPGEPRAAQLAAGVRHRAYPAKELAGLIFAYLGPEPVPLLPQFHFLIEEGTHYSWIGGFSASNWLQCVENGLDPTHVSFAHRGTIENIGPVPERIDIDRTEHGMVHKTYRSGPQPGRFYREHHLLMPGISVGGGGQRRFQGEHNDAPAVSARWTVPIDDNESMMVNLVFKPAANAGKLVGGDVDRPLFGRWEALKVQPYKEYRGTKPVPLGYEIPASVPAQDSTLLDSMGPIVNRENECLVPGDSGIEVLRKMYLRAIEAVQVGEDPPGVFRTPTVVTITSRERWVPSEPQPA